MYEKLTTSLVTIPLFGQIRELIRSLGFHMLDEAVKYGISMYEERDINEADKDLKTMSIQGRYITC